MRSKNEVGLAAQIRNAIPGGHTVTEAAELVGKSVDTLLRWRRTGVFVPSRVYQAGSIQVPVYTGADIEAMRRIHLKPGRRPSADSAPRPSPPSRDPLQIEFISRLPPTYRTDRHLERLERVQSLLQEGRNDAAQALLDRLTNITPSDRRFVQREVDAGRRSAR